MFVWDKMSTQTNDRLTDKVDSNFAEIDPTMSSDPRVIGNLLSMEALTIPKYDYFRHIQTDIQPFMRKVVATWMLEVCEEQRCEEQVFPLAINYMDRFLCVCQITRQQLQLLGATCLLMASKIRQCYPLGVDLLCAYTEFSVTPEQVRCWELLVVAKLNWNISAITGYDFVDHILMRMSWGAENPQIRQHAHTLVAVCCIETSFMQAIPSLVASACICAATRGINTPSAPFALADVCRLTQVDPIEVEFTVRHIEHVVAVETAAIQKQQLQQQIQLQQQQQQQLLLIKGGGGGCNTGQSPSVCAAAGKITGPSSVAATAAACDDLGQPETPTDIQDVYF